MTKREQIRGILNENYSQDLRNKHTEVEIYYDVVQPLELELFTFKKMLAQLQLEIQSLNLNNNETHIKNNYNQDGK